MARAFPYTINSIGIIYNPELTGFEIKSFDDLWDSRLEGMVLFLEITTTLTCYGLCSRRSRRYSCGRG